MQCRSLCISVLTLSLAFGLSKPNAEHVFTQIYTHNEWHSPESISGTGSTYEQTTTLRTELQQLLKNFAITSLIDAPCGDFNWMRLVDLSQCTYIGIDIVKPIIEKNRTSFTSATCTFKHADVITDPLPKVDLIFCRDMLVHFSFQDICKTLKNFKKSGSKYLLTTTFIGTQRINKHINTGDWRPLNLQKQPFNFPFPLMLIDEKCTENNGIYRDKCMGLWDLTTLVIPDIKK